jgi:small GTP-binding protein
MANQLKVVLLGNSNVGKTSLMHQWIHESSLYRPNPTISAAMECLEIQLDQILYRVTIVDTAGQETYRSVIPISVREAHVAVIVYDMTSEESFRALSDWINFVKSIEDATIVIVGNKSDLSHARAVSQLRAFEFAKNEGLQYCETSACTGEGVDIAFHMTLVAAVDKFRVAKTIVRAPRAYERPQRPGQDAGAVGCC